MKNLLNVQSRPYSHITLPKRKICNHENATQLQSKCRLWSVHRAGRITANNFKCAVQTNPDKPSASLVKKVCYPQQHAITNSTTRSGCEHESTAVDEFFNWFSLDYDDPELLRCMYNEETVFCICLCCDRGKYEVLNFSCTE